MFMKKIALSGHIGKGLYALVDDEDYDKLTRHSWCYTTGRVQYVRCSFWENGKIKNVKMHSLILGKLEGYVIDHKDGNTLNNQRSNLRHCTLSENARNRRAGKNNKSGFKGVYWSVGSKNPNGSWKQKPAWIASIRQDGKPSFIGRFSTLEDAARARIAKEVEVYGDYARPDIIRQKT